jgi:hypothetical protein
MIARVREKTILSSEIEKIIMGSVNKDETHKSLINIFLKPF